MIDPRKPFVFEHEFTSLANDLNDHYNCMVNDFYGLMGILREENSLLTKYFEHLYERTPKYSVEGIKIPQSYLWERAEEFALHSIRSNVTLHTCQGLKIEEYNLNLYQSNDFNTISRCLLTFNALIDCEISHPKGAARFWLNFNIPDYPEPYSYSIQVTDILRRNKKNEFN